MKLFLACLAAMLGALTVGAQEPAPGTADGYEKLLAVLPETSRHHFAAVNPAWRQEVLFMRLRPDAFVSVNNPSDKEKAALYKFVRYFDAAVSASEAVKSFMHRPGGGLYDETDNMGEGNFCRHFFPDGSVADFTHWRKQRWVAGIAVDPQTRQENHFSGGDGSLTTHPEARDVHTDWYHDGRIFFQANRDGSRRTTVRLDITDDGGGWDCLVSKRADEELSLHPAGEIWTRQAGGEVSFQEVFQSDGKPYKGDVPHRRMFGSGRPSEKIQDQQTLAAWKIIYNDKRRPDFMKRYSEILAAAGQSWESLHIEFIRDGAPWPDR